MNICCGKLHSGSVVMLYYDWCGCCCCLCACAAALTHFLPLPVGSASLSAWFACLACHATPGSHKSCLAFKCRSSGLAIKQLPLAAHRTLDAACSISSATPCNSICPFIISVSIGSWGTWGYYYWPARLALCKLIFRDLAILSVQIVKGNGS